MKVALLAPGASIHAVRLANGLSDAGACVYLITQHAPKELIGRSVEVVQFPNRGVLGYYTMAPKCTQLLKAIQPDVLNAHYASGYGTVGRLTGFQPYLLSVWGSDIYDFPNKSFVHKYLIRKNLRAANRIASTSHCMGDAVRQLVPEIRSVSITPFGVDFGKYQSSLMRGRTVKSHIVIGTVKSLERQYGIDTLLEAFALVVGRLASYRGSAPQLELRIVGAGSQEAALRAMAKRLKVYEKVRFIGWVPHARVPSELANFDIYVSLSRQESFGVAALEASAAGLPTIVSDAPGLKEVTLDGITGLVVPREDHQAAADALERLISLPSMRSSLGLAGRKHVETHYKWGSCVNQVLALYKEVTQDKN